MKKITILTACLAVTLAAAGQVPMNPDRNPNVKVTVLGPGEAHPDSVKVAFEENAPSTKEIEGIPRFAIVGKDRLFYMGLGANLKVNGAFDWGADANSLMDFTPAAFTPSTPGNRSSLGFTAQESNIYMNIIALPATINRFSLFFAASFKGEKYGFKLKHFYGKYRGLTLGYTNDAFTDGDAVPYTIDSEGPNGAVSYKTLNAYWTQDFGSGFSGAIGVNTPSASMTNNNDNEVVNQRIISVPLYVQYRWGKGSHLRLSGLLRPMQYRNLIKGENKALWGWGVQLSGLWQFAPKWCAYYDAVIGQGISDYLGDGGEVDSDATPSYVSRGKIDMSKSWGISAGLSYDITDKLQANAVYSQMRLYRHDGSLIPENDYRYGQYITANLIYSLNRFVKVGAEYNYGKRRAFTPQDIHVNRIQALFSLAF